MKGMRLQMKVLSISIAAYNIEKYLPEILDGIVQFDKRDMLEVIIVNDGSKDRTEEIARQYANNYPSLFKLVNKPNGGWGSTVNFAIEKATGKYFKLLDGDDYFNLDNLKGFLTFLEACNADMVISQYQLFNDTTGEIYPMTVNRSEFDRKGVFGFDCVPALYQMHEVTFKTELLQKSPLNITEHCFYTDTEYVVKGINRVETVSAYPKVIYMYRIARLGQSVSIEGRIKHYKDHLMMVKKIMYILNAEITDKDKKRIVTERLHSIIKIQCNIYLSMKPSAEVKKELMMFDLWVKENCPELYEKTSRPMYVLRKSRFTLYVPIAKIVRLYENKRQ